MTDERAANANDRKLGHAVRTRRLEIGMSQERLAELLGVTFQQVQKYEKGVNRIAASRLWDIAAAMDCDVGHFFAALRTGPASHVMQASMATAESVELNQLFATIKTPVVRKRVVGVVRALAEEAVS